MGRDVLVLAEHLGGSLGDITFELLGLARPLADELGGSCLVGLIGGSDAMVGQLGAADKVARVDAPGLEDFNPEGWIAAARELIGATEPALVLIGHTSVGMDLAGALSAALQIPLASSVTGVTAGEHLVASATLYGGKMNAEIDLGPGPAIAAVISGAGTADTGRAAGSPEVIAVAPPTVQGRVRFEGLVQPEAADVDITASEVLVAIGRGIGDQDGVEVAQELADALGSAVAASRPIVDAGWLPKSRQVGKSGLKVTPKVYLALGISGAPEHLEGIKGASTVIAVNTDPAAPIFRVADYGLVADLYDVCEELVEILE